MTLEHHHQQSREVKTLDNKYVQIDSCWVNCATGPDSAGDTKEGPGGQRGMTSYGIIPVVLFRQDLIDSDLGGGKASRQALTKKYAATI